MVGPWKIIHRNGEHIKDGAGMDRGWEKNRVHGITEKSEKIVLGSHQHQILMGSRIHKWCWNLSTGSSDRKVTH